MKSKHYKKSTIEIHANALKRKLAKDGLKLPEGIPTICKNKAFEKICAYFERLD